MMTENPSLLRRVYDGMAMFAMLNLVGLVGLLALLSSSGTLNIEKVRRIVGVMRGEEPVRQAAGQFTGSIEGADRDGVSEAAPVNEQEVAAALNESDTDVQIMRLEGERIKAELDQRLALNNTILLRVTTERERFQRERDAAVKQQDQARRKRQSDGFRKQIAIYEALSPKVAVEHLLSLPDLDDAAAIFLELDTRKAKKIIEAAKRPDQKEAAMTILRRIREIEPEKFDKLSDGGG